MIKARKKNNERGFLLYLSVVLSGLAISVGLFMLNVSQREVLFSGYAKASDIAFYAAEAGAECALYWDLIGVNKRTAFPQYLADGNAFLDQVICTTAWSTASAGPGFSTPIVVSATGPSGFGFVLGSATTGFAFNVMVEGKGYCASVSVLKIVYGSGVITVVSSDGYNVDCASKGSSVTTNVDRFSRTIRLLY